MSQTNKTIIIAILFSLAVGMGLFIAGCAQKAQTIPAETPLFNESLNQQLENLTNATNVPVFQEFMYNYTTRNDTKYELARDDVFTLSKGNFTSLQISVLGIKLGDNEETVINTLGLPDRTLISVDKTIKNMEYGKTIGVGTNSTPLTYHIENDTVTQINIRASFHKYLHGNTTFGQTRDYLYATLGEPDYQEFIMNYKVFHYVDKGIDIYTFGNKMELMSLVMPMKFKGVKYITTLENISAGVTANVTRPVLIQ